MALELVKEKCINPVNTVVIGKAQGKCVKIGGESCMPFLFEEGQMPNAPAVCMEIMDIKPEDWPDNLKRPFGSSLNDPADWAAKCVGEFGAKLLCVKLQGAHPDYGKRAGSDILKTLSAIRKKVDVPLVIIGSGDGERDNEVLPQVSQELKGENCLIGVASQANYKTLAATCLADGHSIIAESPIDINIAKQVNILISDMGFDASRIVMHPTTTSLGYGMEYVYSIMERARLAAFIGDKMLSMPFVLFVGAEVWKTKEAKESSETQGVNWELVTTVSMLQSGADLVILRHPSSFRSAVNYIDMAMKTGGSK